MVVRLNIPQAKVGQKRKYLNYETITFTIGVLNIIAAIGAIIVSATILAFGLPLLSGWLAPWAHKVSNIYTEIKNPHTDDDIDHLFVVFTDTAVIGFFDYVAPWILITLAVQVLSFSVLLIIGIRKKNASLVKSFFIFGVILMPMCLLCHWIYVVMCTFFTGSANHEYTSIILMHAIFGVELFMTHMTSRKLISLVHKKIWFTQVERY